MTCDELTAAWADQPNDALIAHIIERYHRPLDAQLDEIEALTAALPDPARWRGVLDAVHALHVELVGHMRKEEKITFPMVRSGSGFMAVPLQVMAHEHDLALELVGRVREATRSYRVPSDAPPQIPRLFELLATIERDLDEHTVLEDLLFRRARQKGPKG
ncbi:MAG: hypothetical protein CSA66_08005 [Proteobacteria bacterium]|nr:MAG: hypothetical protein CSA66_08005 [Pseudomonadota bacterium]